MPDDPPPKDDGTVSFMEFKAKKAPRDDGHALEPAGYKDFQACQHKSLLVDEEKAEVECKKCGAKLNPIWALMRFATEESRLVQRRQALAMERKAWEDRSKTKCRHCGKMTRLKGI